MQKFKDDKHDALIGDIKRIQVKPNMYISYLGSRGACHLAKEAINNMIDECINTNSPGKNISIFIDEEENVFSVTDDGRGIPFESIKMLCTISHSGSKFTREGSGGSSAGENGVGNTAINALSSFFEVKSVRYGERAYIRFEEGEEVVPLTVEKIKDKKAHGTTFTFKPSPRFLGDDCQLPTSDIVQWVEKISYIIPSDITITIDVNKRGKQSSIHKKFKNENHLAGYLKKLSKELAVEPVNIFNSKKVEAFIPRTKTTVERLVGVEVAFSYNSGRSEMISDSFCNFVNTIENGMHVDGAKTAIQQYLTKKVKDSLSEKEAKKLSITFNDVVTRLVLSVSVSTELDPQFASQTKEKVSSQALFQIIRDLTLEEIDAYFSTNPKHLKKIVDIVKQNAKARLAATEARNSVIKGEVSNLDQHKMKCFVPANNKGKQYKELFIIEGDSAMGSARTGRFNDYQALYALTGVPNNTFDYKISEVLAAPTFKQLVHILGCNIGEKFDINKCNYDKIILMTDADVDGRRIRTLMCAFFLVHLPELVLQGRIYAAVTPLYKINRKKNPFITDKKEYIRLVEEKVRESIRVIDPATNKTYNNKEMQQFLLTNRDYLEELTRIAKHFSLSPLLLETIIFYKDHKDFLKIMKEKYPEITIDGEYLSGIHEGVFQILIMDKIFMKKIKGLQHHIHQLNKDSMFIRVCEVDKKGKVIEDHGIKTIGELMIMCQKYNPEILMRYKGLGELQPAELRDTTLDPTRRTLIQLTVSDIEKDLEILTVLQGKKGKKELKKLMTGIKIAREELDN